MCFENLVARLPGKNLLHCDAEAGRERRRNMNGIFSRIPGPETFSKDAAAKGRFGVAQNLGLGMVRHLICGDAS